MDEGSVDLAFADPPFNIGYKYDVYEDRMAADKYLAWSKKWGEALVRTLKPTGTFWLAIGDDFAAELKLMFQRELGLVCRSWVIWYYTFGVHCKQKFSRSHTHLFHFVKDPKNFTFNTESVRVPSARQLVYADARDRCARAGFRMIRGSLLAAGCAGQFYFGGRHVVCPARLRHVQGTGRLAWVPDAREGSGSHYPRLLEAG